MSEPETCELLCLDLPKAEALRLARPGAQTADRLAAMGNALGEPTRIMVAVALREGDELCVCDLAWVCERSNKVVSHHLRILRSAGVVASRRDGRMVMYALTSAGCALLSAVAGEEAVLE